jgi:hypothetical protein
MALELSERKEVLEKSGLCMFCLKHAAELECYGRGGMSKPRCTEPRCDGEHTPSVHKLMAEEHVGVNLVAEDEVENEDKDRDWEEDEGWWVGTVGAVEMPNHEEGFLSEVDESGAEHPQDNYFSGGAAEDGRWSPGSIQPYSVKGGTGAQRPSAGWPPHNESTAATDGPLMGQLSYFTGTKRRRLRKKSKTTVDREWEEARQDAWLRQMLSDTSSNKDEEHYGRFAESGRWMAELFEIPQHLAATSGGECSE